jgi:hypothetical protein
MFPEPSMKLTAQGLDLGRELPALVINHEGPENSA